MRIAIVCPYDLGRFGGVQDQAIKLTDWLREAGHEALLLGPGTTGPPGATLLGPTIIVPSNGSTSPISMRPGVWRKVQQVVADCDVVHIHEPLMPTVSLQSMRKLDKPLVGTFHADVPRVMRGVLRTLRGTVRRWTARLAAITAVSPIAAQVLEGVADYRIVPNGLDVALYGTGDEDRAPAQVMFLGRDDPRKGLDVLLAAWPQIRSAVPTAQLVVAGTARPPAEAVSFLGRVSEEEKRSLLRSSAVFVAPNLGGESFGIVLTEAMAAGCAIVASDLPAFVEVLGQTGSIVPAGDPEATARSVIALLEDDIGRAAMQRSAGARVERFDKAAVTAGYVEAYESALHAT